MEDRSSAPSELSMSYDEGGRFIMRFSAPGRPRGPGRGRAEGNQGTPLFRAGRPTASMGDAMRSSSPGRSPPGAVTSINRRDAYRTYVHLDTEGAWLTGKPRLPRQITEKLTCDGILQPIWHTQGTPVNVGRAQRIVPTRTRRLVEDRDRGCRFPGCTSTHVECHHLIPWADGGPTDTPNLAGLCPFHHDAHHNGDFTISGNAGMPRRADLHQPRRVPHPTRAHLHHPSTHHCHRPATRDTAADRSTRVIGVRRSNARSTSGATRAQRPTADPAATQASALRWVTFDEPRLPSGD